MRPPRWLETAAILPVAMLVSACGGTPSHRVENAVLVCLDTVREDTLALTRAFHAGDAAERVWRQATVFRRAQSASPWTLPSVGSAFTGLYPNRHRAGAFAEQVADLSQSVPVPMRNGVPTLAMRLADHGFETRGFIAHGWLRFGLQRGFAHIEEIEPVADLGSAAFTRWLSERPTDARPFFAYLHFMDAHRPMHLGPRQLAAAGPMEPAFAAAARRGHPTACADPRSLLCLRYLGYVRAVDRLRRTVAEVVGRLEAEGLRDRSVVVVFADHGEEFGEHEAQQRARALDPRGSYGLGHGHSLFQEQLHVPLAIWHPALPPGEVDVAVSIVDLAPTLLGWLGIGGEGALDGIDLGPLLAGTAAPPTRPLFASSVAFGPERAAVVMGDHKRIGDGGSGAGPLRFDLADDPGERAPAPDDGALAEMLRVYRERSRPAGRRARPAAAEIRRLQALGYLTGADGDAE